MLNQTYSRDAMVDYFINFFKNNQEQKLKKQEKCTQNKLSDSHFLLCLDNAEEIILNDREEFVQFLA